VRAEVTFGVMSPPRLPIDSGTTISAICQKKPMISKAGILDGLYDGIWKLIKYFVQRIQMLNISVDNRVGVMCF
jgi:hypothetical protein